MRDSCFRLAEFLINERENSGRDNDDHKGRDRPPDRVVNFVLPDCPDAQDGAGNERDCDDGKGNVAHEARFKNAL